MAIDETDASPWSARRPIDLDAVVDDRLVFDFDRDSDTLMVHLLGRGRPAVSIEAGDNAYVRLDRAADEIVGFQLEGFLHAVMPRHPGLRAHAAIYGIESDSDGNQPRTVSTAARRAALAALVPLFAPGVVGAVAP